MSLGLWTETQLSSTAPQLRDIVRLLELMKWLVQRLHMQQGGVALINCPCLPDLPPKKKSEQSIFHRSQIWSTFVIKQPPLLLPFSFLPPPSNRTTKTSATTQLEAKQEGAGHGHGCLLVAYVTRRDADKYAKRALGEHRNFRQERERGEVGRGGGG